MSRQNIITGVVVVTGIAGVYALLKLARFQNELAIIPSASVHKINLSMLTIRLDLLLKNPTKGSYKVKFPFVKLLYKDVMIGSSQVVDRDIEIPRFGQVKIEKIMIDVPLFNLFSIAATIVKAIQNKEKVKMNAQIVTTLTAGLVSKPLETTKEITIKS